MILCSFLNGKATGLLLVALSVVIIGHLLFFLFRIMSQQSPEKNVNHQPYDDKIEELNKQDVRLTAVLTGHLLYYNALIIISYIYVTPGPHKPLFELFSFFDSRYRLILIQLFILSLLQS